MPAGSFAPPDAPHAAGPQWHDDCVSVRFSIKIAANLQMTELRLDVWWASDIGRVRKSNQDTVACFPDRGLFMVADGMGGHAAGEIASRMAVDVIGNFLGRADRRTLPDRAAETLRAAVELANQRIFAAGGGEEEAPNGRMGSTIVLLLVDLQARLIAWAHVGDSRLYRGRGGNLELLTADHTIFGHKYLGQTAIPVDLAHTNILLQALGTSPEVSVPTSCAEVLVGDTFLLCSDGVSGFVDASVIRTVLTSPHRLEEIGQTLISSALEAGGRDNASAVLVRVVSQ